MNLFKALKDLRGQLRNDARLYKKEVIEATLPADSKYATIVSAAKVTGDITYVHERVYGSVKHRGYEGVDKENAITGYLSHNGQYLRLATPEKQIFDLPIAGLKVKKHGGLGIIVTTPQGDYAIGKSLPLPKTNNEVLNKAQVRKKVGQISDWVTILEELGLLSPEM